MEPWVIFAIVAVILIIVAIWLYERKDLNRYLPTSWQKSGFVGSMGRAPALEQTLKFDPTNPHVVLFNYATHA